MTDRHHRHASVPCMHGDGGAHHRLARALGSAEWYGQAALNAIRACMHAPAGRPSSDGDKRPSVTCIQLSFVSLPDMTSMAWQQHRHRQQERKRLRGGPLSSPSYEFFAEDQKNGHATCF